MKPRADKAHGRLTSTGRLFSCVFEALRDAFPCKEAARPGPEGMLTRKNEACQDCGVELRIESEGDVYFIIPEGRMLAGEGDLLLKQELDRLRNSGCKKIAIDFSAVPYIDSSVLGQLVHGYSLLKKEGGGLKLLNPTKRITDLLSLTRLIKIFEIYDSRQALLDSLRRRI